MSSFPLRPHLKTYGGRKETLRRKTMEINAIRTRVAEHVNHRGGSGNLHSGAEWSFCLTAASMAADQER